MRRQWTLVLLLISVWLSPQLHAQSFAPIAYTVNSFQDHSCDFYAFDAQNRLIRNFQTGDFVINNGSTSFQATSVSCPSSSTPQKLSVVLCLDVSGSMSQDNPVRMSTVKNAANLLVSMIDTTQNEVAVTSFDHLSYINQDFTSSKSLLTQAINSLQPQGATDYNNALLAAPTGALNVATRGQYKRVVILMTDGDGGGKLDSIVNFARLYNITIYTISYHLQAPQILYDMAVQTGGIEQGDVNRESLNTEVQLKAAFRAALVHAQGVQPCTVHWFADRYCYSTWRYASIAIPSMGIPAVGQYYWLPYNKIPFVGLSPYSLTFGAVAPGTYVDKTFSLSAPNAAINIDAGAFTNAHFQVINWGGSAPPFRVDSGTNRIITVRYTASDTSYQFGSLQLQSNMCYWQFVGASAGYQSRTVPQKTISLINPVNPENYNSCYYTYYRWDGVAAGDSVRFEWSYDSARTWTMLVDNFYGNFEQWFRTPQRTGTNNRIRISHIKFQNDRFQTLKLGHSALLKQCVYNPQNSTQAVVCTQPDTRYLSSTKAFVVNLQTGDTLATLTPGSNRLVQSVMWTPDGSNIITLSNGSPGAYLQFWTTNSYQLIRSISDASSVFSCAAINTAGTRIAVGVASPSNPVRVYDASTGSLIYTLSYHVAPVSALNFSADGSRLASVDANGRLVVWSMTTGTRITSMDPSGVAQATSVCFNPTSSDAVAVSYATGITRLWSVSSSSETRSFSGSIGAHYYATFNPAGTRILSCGETAVGAPGVYRGAMVAWDPSTGNSVMSIDGSGFRNQHAWKSTCAQYSADGTQILSANGYGGLNTWSSSGVHAQQMMLRKAARGAVVSGCFYNNDKNVATLGEDGSVITHDVNTRDTLHCFYDLAATASKVNEVRVSPNGLYMAALSTDGSMALWNLQSNQLISRMTGAGVGPAFSNNSQYVAVVADTVLRVFASATGVLVKQQRLVNFASARGLCYGYNDEKLLIAGLASTTNACVIALSTSTWSEVGRFTDTWGVGGECSRISFAPGARFTTLYHAASGRGLRLDSTLSLVSFINDNVQAITPNAGYEVGVMNTNGQVRLWRTSDNAVISTVNPHQGYAVSQVALSANSSRALICSNDGNAWLWDCLATPIQADTSATPFVIGTSQLVIRDTINFGKVLNNGAKDSVINKIIQNIGSSWDYIYSVQITGYNKDEFRIVKKNTGLYLYPGQSLDYELGFIPRTKVVGYKEAYMSVVTLCDTLHFVLIGESVNPPTANVIDQIDFGNVEIGTKKDTTVAATIKNVTDQPLTISNTKILGPDTLQFSIVSGGGSFVLQPNETRTITLRFAPTVIALTSARLAFYHAFLGSPAIILLSGNGIGIPRISTQQTEVALVSPICSSLKAIDSTVRISNSGTGVMRLDSAKILGSDSIYFKVTSTFPDSMAAGSSKDIHFQYIPRFAGQRAATLRVYSNAQNTKQGTLDVQVKGTRDTVILSFSQLALDLLNVRPFTSVDAFVTLNNRGSVAMSLPVPVHLGKFTITSISPNPIPSGQSARVNINFNNGDTSMVYDTLYTVLDTCGGASSIELRAYTQSPRPTLYVLSSMSMSTKACAPYRDTTIILTNVGMKDMQISDVSIVSDTAHQFQLLYKPGSIVPPDGLDSIVVRYQPSGSDSATAILRITSNAQNAVNGVSDIPLSATWLYTAFRLDSSVMTFAEVLPNTPATESDSLVNVGTAPIQWILPQQVGPFSLVDVQPNPTPVGATAVYTVQFAGGPSGSVYVDTLDIVDQCAKKQSLVLMETVQSLRPRIQMAPFSSFDLNCVSVLDTFLVVRNSGLDTLRIDSMSIRSAAPPKVSITSTLPLFLLPGTSDTLRVHIDATALGNVSASVPCTVHLLSNSDRDSILDLSGTITIRKANLQYAQSVLVFPLLREWRKTTQQIMVYNTGTLPLSIQTPVVHNAFSLDSLSKNPVPVGDSAIAYVRFAGDSAGIYVDTLAVHDNCGVLRPLPVSIEVQKIVPAHLQSITHMQAYEQCYPSLDTAITVRNTGGDNLMVSRVFLRGTNADEFAIINDTSFELEPSAFHIVLVRHYSHSYTGLRTAELVMISNTDSMENVERTIQLNVQKDSVDMIWKDAPFFFGIVDRGNDYTATMRLVNDGSLDQTIPTPMSGKFFVIDSIVPNPVPLYSVAVAYMHFHAPDSVGTIHESLSFKDLCNHDNPVDLSANIRAHIRVYALDTTVNIGEIFRYPLYIEDVRGAKLSGIQSITANVEWNTTLLSLRSVQHGSLISSVEDGELRKVQIQGQAINGSDSILAILELQAALGNDVQTPLHFASVIAQGGTAVLDANDATVFVSGQCTDGGTRLMDRAKATALKAVFPNPGDGNITIDLSTPEQAAIQIRVMDAMGKEIKTLYDGLPAAAEWQFRTTIADLPSGVYTIVLHTPTAFATRRVELVR